jgi:autotransporter strand-loop-strand O-heptosyltransferase
MNRAMVNFVDGPKVEIQGDDTSLQYRIEFIDTTIDEIVYVTTITAGHWAASNLKYYVPWRIKVYEDDKGIIDYTLDLKDKDALIIYDSRSLGDNIAWLPMVEEFRKKHACKITVMSFWNNILKGVYPDLQFAKHDDTGLPSFFAVYHLGAFDNDYNKNRNNWRLIPLQQIGSDILGIPQQEIQPKVKRSDQPRPFDKPYVCLSEFSTWQAKQWNYPGGWQMVADKLKAAGYVVVSISKEQSRLKGVIKRNGNSIEATIRTLQYADAFIGASTGLVVLAWALEIPVCLVSGSTMPWSEFQACTRVINKNVCHGCFNDLSHPVDRGNWKYCPRGRNYECTTSIPPDVVWQALQVVLSNKPQPTTENAKVMFLTPHCSTGGGPQYLLRCVQELRNSGREVTVVEYANISDDYTVQKNKIKLLVPFQTLNDGKAESLKAAVTNLKPGIIHLHEFGERFLDPESAAFLYAKDRPWKIIETPHGGGIEPKDKRWWPDAFAFVCRFHQEMFKDTGIPSTVIEYTLPKQKRPDRTVALDRLGLDPAQKHILNIGLFSPHKNQGEVFEIARHMPDLQFHFVGNTADNYKDYWAPLLETQPPNAVVWGERSDVELFYAAMDAFLFASTGELNPLVVKEAIAWSLPVFMRNLPTYCGLYDKEPLVTFIDADVEKTCGLIRKQFPLEVSMGFALEKVYELGTA